MTNELSREEELIGKYLDYEICFVGNQPAAAWVTPLAAFFIAIMIYGF